LLYEFGATADEISCPKISKNGEERPHLGGKKDRISSRFLAIWLYIEGLGNGRA
jgi:hypothetical protein